MKTIYSKKIWKRLSVGLFLIIFTLCLGWIDSSYAAESSKKHLKKQSSQKHTLALNHPPRFANENPYNDTLKEMLDKVQYPLSPSSKVGLVVKNKVRVGLSMQF